VLVVGGGAGGVELTLAMHAPLKGKAEFALGHRGRELLPGHNARVRARLAGVLQAQDVEVLAERSVAKVSQKGGVSNR
jgi:selenide,water dikinase